MTPEHILLAEFSTWYSGDEIADVDDVFMDQLQAKADSSAKRLRRAAGADGIEPIVALLGALRADRGHPLHRALDDRLVFAWTNDDETFAVFQTLADAMIASLRRGPTVQSPIEIVWDYGNEHNPVSPLGRLTVTLTVDGAARLEQRARGRHRVWHGRQTEGAWEAVLAVLGAAQFPRKPKLPATIPPDSPSFTVSLRRTNRGLVRLQLPGAVVIPGYDDVNRTMFSIVSQMGADILGFAPPPGPVRIVDVRAD